MIHTNPQHPELIVAFRWRAVYKYYYFIIRGDNMRKENVRCPMCGTMNYDVDLDATDSWTK